MSKYIDTVINQYFQVGKGKCTFGKGEFENEIHGDGPVSMNSHIYIYICIVYIYIYIYIYIFTYVTINMNSYFINLYIL